MNKNIYYLHSNIAKNILNAMDEGQYSIEISTNLNKDTMSIKICGDTVEFDNYNKLNKEHLQFLLKKTNKVFVLNNNELRSLELWDDSYYKLVPTEQAPTVEIDGIKMHRSKGIDPFENARLNAEEIVKKGDRVLDTCGGLGYTAIWASRLGAREVVSVEYNKSIRNLRKENPWSQELFDDKIKLISGDVSKYIKKLESGSIDSILHDPPRFSLAGELYGEAFYKELYRVLVKKGKLFHYTGSPYSVRKGNMFYKNTLKRLQKVGFRNVCIKEKILGITAVK